MVNLGHFPEACIETRQPGPSLPAGFDQPPHELAYRAFIGPVPEGMEVIRTCGNAACSNPRHMAVEPRRASPLDPDNSADVARLGEACDILYVIQSRLVEAGSLVRLGKSALPVADEEGMLGLLLVIEDKVDRTAQQAELLCLALREPGRSLMEAKQDERI